MICILCVLIIFALAGCKPASDAGAAPIKQPNTVTQQGSYHTLLVGDYQGTIAIADMLSRGNFGLGTYADLDGEMILLDGQFYQADERGQVKQPLLTTTTPFATVCFFTPEHASPITDPIRLIDMEIELLRVRLDADKLYAIKIKGDFGEVQYRSFPKQSPPYKPFTQVETFETRFTQRNVSGTLVGFYYPAWYGDLNADNFHFHWISDDKKSGGHVIDAAITQGSIEFCDMDQLLVMNPSPGFKRDDVVPVNEAEEMSRASEVIHEPLNTPSQASAVAPTDDIKDEPPRPGEPYPIPPRPEPPLPPKPEPTEDKSTEGATGLSHLE
ncbi:acetolactate decarboxylase [Poriferisphaera sp. WC338]|uniref:acetolactate decarboxylase n=1 Tax=Poriferisphaera sp. WC338 TaxID=3425129 RepID=UPI003D819E5D